MNVSEYIVDYLEKHGVTDYFGYQGTMIAYFIEAVCSNPHIRNHSCYNEQGAAFAACGCAKASGRCAVAYATSGPGALNLVSGIADAYYDSAPVLFITGQLNTNEYTDIPTLRQQGFQQTDVVNIVKPITKYAAMIKCTEDVLAELEKAWFIANTGRKGPVVLDIPMNIQRSEMPDPLPTIPDAEQNRLQEPDFIDEILQALDSAKRPLLLLGNGIGRDPADRANVEKLIAKLKIPVITSMPGLDLLPSDSPYHLGYIGAAYGFRAANLVVYKKADLILSLGCSMCRRQTSLRTEEFAKDAKIIRIDIDPTELKRKVHEDETAYVADANAVIRKLLDTPAEIRDYTDWLKICAVCREKTEEFNATCTERQPNRYIEALSQLIPENAVVAVDVGQHQVWTAQSFQVRKGQKLIFSGGHGAMGFSLPAAIGAYYGTGAKPFCIAGDGAFQMNIQELQWVVREDIPITIFVMNNHALGLITQQQDDFFGGRHYGAAADGGFTSPDFSAVARAYGLNAHRVSSEQELASLQETICGSKPVLIEILLPPDTKAYPKTYFGQAMHNQKPYIPDELLEYLLSL